MESAFSFQWGLLNTGGLLILRPSWQQRLLSSVVYLELLDDQS